MTQNTKIKFSSFIGLAGFISLPLIAAAHENYVLTQDQINADLGFHGPSVFSALNNPGNLKISLIVALLSTLGIIVFFIFSHSSAGRKMDNFLQKGESFGQVVLRMALAVSLLASAYFNSFLGPEISLTTLPLAFILKPALVILGILMFLGLWSEIVGVLSLVILFIASWVYKDYMITYFNYFGEFLALAWFGSRVFSLDKLFYKTPLFAKASAHGPLKKFKLLWAKRLDKKYHDWELLIIRVTYGISIIYPAITYKLIHPEVIVDIANRYNLMQFHWLFPGDPLLISLGTGLAQVAVGVCVTLGFETRLNTLVTFGLMFLSVIFFKEAVWPHIVLLALALYLIINNGGKYSLDNYIEINKEKFKTKLFKRVI